MNTTTSEDPAIAAAARDGDEAAFTALTRRYRRQLQVHCYRMVGSPAEAEDLVQETFLRAWRRRETYEQRSSFRAWLYRIATNACIDALAKRPSHRQVATEGEDIPWLEPIPDRILDESESEESLETQAIARETIELAFLAAMQRLPPRQRAALILREVLGWSASEVSELLGITPTATHSALQRARETLERHGAETTVPTEAEQKVLRRYIDAIEHADDSAIAAVLREDVRIRQRAGAGGNTSAKTFLLQGRDAVIAAWAPLLHGTQDLGIRFLPIAANRQPAAAMYLRMPGAAAYLPFALAVLTVMDEKIADIDVFGGELFAAFGLPASL